jgi:hypothetical protein
MDQGAQPILSERLRLIAAFAFFVLAAFALWKSAIHSQLQADLTGAWVAGRLENAGEDPYGGSLVVDGRPFPRVHFIYGPLVATLFRPLGLLDWDIARSVWFVIETACLAGILALHLRPLSRALSLAALILIACPLLVHPVYAHLERGQVDLITALLVSVSLTLWERGSGRFAGVVLVCAAVIKLPVALILVAPLAARDRRFIFGSIAATIGALLLALAIEGPSRVMRYASAILPHVDREGTLPPQIFSRATPRDSPVAVAGRIADFGAAGNGSVTRLLRRHWGHDVGSGLAATGLVLTVIAAGDSLRGGRTTSSLSLSWFAATAAMLAFQPMTWLMGCVHLIPLALRLPRLTPVLGTLPVNLVTASLVLVCAGEPIARWLPPRFGHRTMLGVLAIWCVLIVALCLSPRKPPPQRARLTNARGASD